MNKNSKKILMFGMTSLLLMTGCKKSKTVEINGESYLQNGNEYVSISMEPKVFEAGTHYITYSVDGSKKKFISSNGWNANNIIFPEVPEGYEYVNSFSMSTITYSHTNAIVHVYVNKVPVEVEPTYNAITGQIEYNNIGKPVKKLILEKEN